MYQFIETAVDGRVATLTLNRPECLNAVSAEMSEEIMDALKVFDADPEVGVIVIAGRGKHFCAGGDIRIMKKYIDEGKYITGDRIGILEQMVKAIRTCSKPVICMIQNVATGAGCCIAMACDFRTVTPSSRLGMAFINLGLPGDTGGIYLMLKLIGPAYTSKMVMTGEMVNGEEAYRIGLASFLFEEGKLEEGTYAFARKLAARSATGIKRQKELINRYVYNEMDKFFLDEQRGMVWASRQPDFTEAVNAFLEKRPAELNKPWPEGITPPECEDW